MSAPALPRRSGPRSDPRCEESVAFELAIGAVDDAGAIRRRGRMRPASPEQERDGLKDFLVHLDPAAFVPVLLAKVARLDGCAPMSPFRWGRLAPVDLWFLEALYRRLNGYTLELAEPLDPSSAAGGDLDALPRGEEGMRCR
jgi:hypothetical protein